jgi:hypothetical protein
VRIRRSALARVSGSSWGARGTLPGTNNRVIARSLSAQPVVEGGYRRQDQRRGAGGAVIGGDHDPEAIVLAETLKQGLDRGRLAIDGQLELIRPENGRVHEAHVDTSARLICVSD